MPEPTRDQLEVLLRTVRVVLSRLPTQLREQMLPGLLREIDAVLPSPADTYRPPTPAQAFERGIEIKEQPDD